MTDLAVTVYDTGNAIISIKTTPVGRLSLCLAPLFLRSSQPHGSVPRKRLKRDTVSNWHETKARRDQATGPKTRKTDGTALRAFT